MHTECKNGIPARRTKPKPTTVKLLEGNPGKHGLNVHAVIFDDLHSQPNRELFNVMTKGSGASRTQPLFFL